MSMDQNEALEPHEKAIAAIGAHIAHLEADGIPAVAASLPCPVCAMGQLSWLCVGGNSIYYQCNNLKCVHGHIAR